MIPFRKRPNSRTLIAEKSVMSDAVSEVLTEGGLEFYSQLSDNQVLGYAQVLWDYHADLRDEWSRREMNKAADAK